MSYAYGLHGLPVPQPYLSPAQEETARKRRAFDQAVEGCIGGRLLRRRFSLHARGCQVLVLILAHLGWTADDAGTPERRECDALDELLLLLYRPGQSTCSITDFLVTLFLLFGDPLAFGRTRMGEQLLSPVGERVLQAAVHGQAFGEREVFLLLAVRIRDRLLTRGGIRRTDLGPRLTHANRAAIAARLGPR